MARKTRQEARMASHAKTDAKKAMETAKEQFNKAQAHVKKYMKDNPVKAGMMAAGLGAAIGAATVALIRKARNKSG